MQLIQLLVIQYNAHNDINSYYVDGVSITRGSPCQRVWTLMAGLIKAIVFVRMVVTIVLVLKVVYIIKTQLFSLSLVMTTAVNLVILLLMDHFSIFSTLLIHCGTYSSLEGAWCTAPGLPWFHKVLNITITDYIP